jgi:hypothetical protein
MAKLIFQVEVNDSDSDNAQDYLNELRKTFSQIVSLAAWGYSDDQIDSHYIIDTLTEAERRYLNRDLDPEA